jgi:hypothetical protein
MKNTEHRASGCAMGYRRWAVSCLHYRCIATKSDLAQHEGILYASEGQYAIVVVVVVGDVNGKRGGKKQESWETVGPPTASQFSKRVRYLLDILLSIIFENKVILCTVTPCRNEFNPSRNTALQYRARKRFWLRKLLSS